MKVGRFVVDGHVHAQRHAAGSALKKRGIENPQEATYEDLGEVMLSLEAYDNSRRLVYDMECYGVDMCVIMCSFGMSNDLNIELVERYPEKFVALCTAKKSMKKVSKGEEEWSAHTAAAEVDELLSTGKFVGIGEGVPYNPAMFTRHKKFAYTYNTRMDEIRLFMDLARKHKVPIHIHAGTTMGFTIPFTGLPETYNPLWIHDLATDYPDVTIVFDHGGMQAWWWEHFVDQVCHVVASHDNVYMETGLFWADLYRKPLLDPNIGPEKLLWGTDWGASIPIHAQPGHKPSSYAVQLRRKGIVTHQVDIWGWSLRQVSRLDIAQDDLNLILGGNAIRVYRIKPPLTRLFRDVG